MDLITALAISIGLLGGIATFLCLTLTALGLQIWAVFLGWASFYHCGGKTTGLQSSVLANLWGVLWGALTLIAVTGTGLADSIGLPVWAGICVAIGVALMILGAKIPIFSAIPAQVYGYAATVALALLTNATGALTEPSLTNPAVSIALSMVIGGAFGYLSELLAGMLVSAPGGSAAKA